HDEEPIPLLPHVVGTLWAVLSPTTGFTSAPPKGPSTRRNGRVVKTRCVPFYGDYANPAWWVAKPNRRLEWQLKRYSTSVTVCSATAASLAGWRSRTAGSTL